MITAKEIYDVLEKMKNEPVHDNQLRFFSGGTGISDQMCIDYFKDTSVVVTIRNGDQYQYGKLKE